VLFCLPLFAQWEDVILALGQGLVPCRMHHLALVQVLVQVLLLQNENNIDSEKNILHTSPVCLIVTLIQTFNLVNN